MPVEVVEDREGARQISPIAHRLVQVVVRFGEEAVHPREEAALRNDVQPVAFGSLSVRMEREDVEFCQRIRAKVGEGLSCEVAHRVGGRHVYDVLEVEVVVSANELVCDDSTHRMRNEWGEDFAALSESFLEAGSQSVIASLWQVKDESTQRLMVSFYDHLREGNDEVVALALASRETMRMLPHPTRWGAFVVTSR